MKNQKTVILLKDLPACPKGRIFKSNIDGDFFHFITTEEHIEGKFKPYRFSEEEVKTNTDWFSFFDEDKIEFKALQVHPFGRYL